MGRQLKCSKGGRDTKNDAPPKFSKKTVLLAFRGKRRDSEGPTHLGTGVRRWS
jgi:rRNA maturation protein Nop10